MQCLITEPTRITPTSETLLDVILTNKSNLFRTECSFNPEIWDHHLIYGMLKQSALQYRRMTITLEAWKTWKRFSLMKTWQILPGLLERHSMPSLTNMTHGKPFLKVYLTNICRKRRWELDRKMYHIWRKNGKWQSGTKGNMHNYLPKTELEKTGSSKGNGEIWPLNRGDVLSKLTGPKNQIDWGGDQGISTKSLNLS